MPRLTDRQRAVIPNLLAQGLSKSKIADLLNCDRHTVTKWMDENRDLRDRPRSGRPHVLSQEERSWIIAETQDQRRRSVRVLQDKVKTHFRKPVSTATIWSVLIAAGLHPYHRQRRPNLTSAHKAKRLAWAHANRRRDWRNGIWVDETHFAYMKSLNVHNDVVWASSSANIPVYETVKYPTFTKCALFLSHKHCERSMFYRGKLNSTDFRNMVQKAKIAEQPRKWVQGSTLGDVFLLLDCDSAHKGEFKKWAEHAKLEVVMLPPHSPDLDPAENFISIINQKIDMEKLRSVTELEGEIDTALLSANRGLLSRLVLSMSKRVENVIAAYGGHARKY